MAEEKIPQARSGTIILAKTALSASWPVQIVAQRMPVASTDIRHGKLSLSVLTKTAASMPERVTSAGGKSDR